MLCNVRSAGSVFPAFVRHYARRVVAMDPQNAIIRRALYPSNIRNRASPTGGWRTDVSQAVHNAIPSVQAHDTIERAWLLRRRHVRKRREAELTRKFACMQRAMDELHRIDPHLYAEANKQEDPRSRNKGEQELIKSLKSTEIRVLDARIRGLFPRELRAPTDTPSVEGWNYEWKPFRRPV